MSTRRPPPPPPSRLVRKAEYVAREAARAPVGSLERALEDYDSAIIAVAIQCSEHPRDLDRIRSLNKELVVPARNHLTRMLHRAMGDCCRSFLPGARVD